MTHSAVSWVGLSLNSAALYVGFSRAQDFLGSLIRFFTGGTVNHSFLLYKDPHLGWMTVGANANGVTYIPLNAFMQGRTIEALFLPLRGSLWDGLNKMKDDINKRYNYFGIVGESVITLAHRWFHDYTLHNALSDPARLYCSEFTVDVIRACGIPILNGSPDNTIDPNEEMEALENSRDFASVPVPSGNWNLNS